MNKSKTTSSNTAIKEKVYNNYLKKYAPYIIAFLIVALLTCSFLLWNSISKNKTILDMKTIFEGEKSNITDNDEVFIAFKDYYDNDPKPIYYLLPENKLSSFPNASTYNEGKAFIISGKIIHIKDEDNSGYWKLANDINISALTEYNGVLSSPKNDGNNYYSFKSCSQEYSNCKYYLLNPENLSDSQLDFINSLNGNEEVKLSGEEKELEGTAGSIYVELINNIQMHIL